MKRIIKFNITIEYKDDGEKLYFPNRSRSQIMLLVNSLIKSGRPFKWSAEMTSKMTQTYNCKNGRILILDKRSA